MQVAKEVEPKKQKAHVSGICGNVLLPSCGGCLVIVKQIIQKLLQEAVL